jgi:transposase
VGGGGLGPERTPPPRSPGPAGDDRPRPPTLDQRRARGRPHRRPRARPARAVREREQPLPALQPLGQARGRGPDHGGARRRRRPGVVAHRLDRGPSPPARRGGGKKGADDQALGRSRGGFGTTVPGAVEALGNPVKVLLRGGQPHDLAKAKELIKDPEPASGLADQGSDSDEFVRAVEARGAEAVLPPRSNRQAPRADDAPWSNPTVVFNPEARHRVFGSGISVRMPDGRGATRTTPTLPRLPADGSIRAAPADDGPREPST